MTIYDTNSNRSKELFSALAALREKPGVGEHILDVRGLGLMVGVEFASPTTVAHDIAYRKDAPKDMASRVTKKCIEKGMYLLTTSIYQVVSSQLPLVTIGFPRLMAPQVRFIPPLNISSADMEKGCKIFSEAVEEVVREG